MDRSSVQRWLDRYIAAWRTNDAEKITALFAVNAEYRFHPDDDPVRGGEAIAAAWLEEPDEPGTWDAWYEPFAVEGSAAAVAGVSTYFDDDGVIDRVYDNVFLLRFADDGRCSSFTEWFVKRPDRDGQG
jgi:hypothetical protein